MKQDETKVDVLAVMDRAAESAGEIVKASNGDFRAVLYQDDLFKARAAIAELIEAVGAFKGKRGAFMALGAQDARTIRLWAALARVRGGK